MRPEALLSGLAEHGSIDFAALFDASPNPYVLLLPDFTIVGMNEAYLSVTMSRRSDIVGRNMFEAFPGTPDERGRDNARQLRESFQRVIDLRIPDHIPLIHYDIANPGGGFEERYWSATHTPLFDPAGELAFILQHTVDVTELHRLRQAVQPLERSGEASAIIESGILRRAQAVQEANAVLDEERQHLRRLFEQAPGFTAVLSGPDHVFEMVNSAYSEIVGHRDIIGKPVAEALPEVASQGFIELLDEVYRSGQPFVGRGIRIMLDKEPAAAPTERFLDFVYQPIAGKDGATVGIFVQGNDITEQRQAENELRTYREHLEHVVKERTQALEESEAQRRQAQKMEAIGQLTGGIAHDFNNLLAVMIGNVELARKRAPEGPVDKYLENALQAGERGAKLTRQLLAFARKQSLSLEPTDLIRTIAGMNDLLARTIGPGVEIVTDLTEDLWTVETDRNQLEVAILNLAINARDAMAAQGTLTVSARNAPPQALPPDLAPGQYVRIAVRDTGSGIPEEMRTKVFDPFFTTKDVGKGTGLGLSQIYGFVKQQGGSIALESEMGRGTEVALFLPRTQGRPEPEFALPSLDLAKGADAHVLVIDDDAGVRNFVTESLKDFGYRISEARHGSDGLAVLRRENGIELVVVDFAMPVLDGMGFLEAAKAERPDLPIILMTGYADAQKLNDMRLQDVPTIMKPFSIKTLLDTLQQNLDLREAIAL